MFVFLKDESAELSEEEEEDEDDPAVIHKTGKEARMEKEKKFKVFGLIVSLKHLNI